MASCFIAGGTFSCSHATQMKGRGGPGRTEVFLPLAMALPLPELARIAYLAKYGATSIKAT